MQIQLYFYRERLNRNEVMNQAMTGVHNEDLGVLAELGSRLPAPTVSGEFADPTRIERGRTLVRKFAAMCVTVPILQAATTFPASPDKGRIIF